MSDEAKGPPQRIWIRLTPMGGTISYIHNPPEIYDSGKPVHEYVPTRALEAAWEKAIGLIATLPTRGTMNFRRGYEEGLREALRTLEAARDAGAGNCASFDEPKDERRRD